MTKREFFHQLHETILASTAKVRIIEESKLRILEAGYSFCPITYLAYKETGTYFALCDAKSVGKAIGLPAKTAYEIISASDSWSEFEWDSRTQKQLAKALCIYPIGWEGGGE